MRHLVPWRLLIGVAVLACAVTLALSQMHAYAWVGNANSTVSALRDNGTLGSLAVLAGAAWLASTARRRGMLRLESSTPRSWARPVVVSGAIAIAGLAGLMVSAVAMAARTLLRHPAIPIPWPDLLPIAFVMPVAAALGYVVGMVVPWPPLAMATAPAAWAVLGFAVGQPSPARLLALGTGPTTFHDVPLLFTLGQSILYASVAVTLVLLLLRTRWIAVPLVVTAVAAGLVVGFPEGSMYPDNPAAARPRCVSGALDYCFAAVETPDSAATIVGLRSALDDARPLLNGRVRFVSEDIDSGFPRDRRIINVTPWANFAVTPTPATVEADVLMKLVNPHNCPTTPVQTEASGGALPVTPLGQVIRWLYQTNGLPTKYVDVPIGEGYAVGPGDLGTRLSRMTSDQQVTWLRAHKQRLLQCDQVN